MDEVTMFLQSSAGSGPIPYKWEVVDVDDREQRALRYHIHVHGEHLKIGSPISSRLNVDPIREKPMPLFDIKASMIPEKYEGDYENPHLVYQISVKTNWKERRVAIMEFTVECGAQSNYLFFLDKEWEFKFDPEPSIHFIGAPLVRYLIGNHPTYYRVAVQFAQAAVISGISPDLTLRVIPRLKYYPGDKPVPPDPRWFVRGFCKMFAYTLRSTKPVETYRKRHREGVGSLSALEGSGKQEIRHS